MRVIKTKTEVKTFSHKLYCSLCKKEMELSHVLTSMPPQYEYICPQCKGVSRQIAQYPGLTYEQSDEIHTLIEDK